MGHVRDLPRSQFGVDVEADFEPKYITIRGKGPVLQELRKHARKAKRVLLATDPDREGEAISWHLAQALKLDDAIDCRLEFHEITRDVIRQAVKNPRPIDVQLVDAQQARRILDRLVGYKLSPLLWRKIRPGLSAGRVQSVALRLICEREKEIETFEPEEYWSLHAELLTPQKATLSARYLGQGKKRVRLGDEPSVQRVMERVSRARFQVDGVQRRERRRQPSRAFSTSTLQQEAARKLNFTARQTMALAQQLYEGLDMGKEGTVGLITYVRTDSSRVAESALAEASAYIKERYGEKMVGKVERTSGENPRQQGAHEAIRPTSVHREPEMLREHLTPRQYRLYKLIWERFVASQMAPAVYDTVSVDIRAGDDEFRASGSVLRFSGFMQVYIEGKDEDEVEPEEMLLPALTEGDVLNVAKLVPQQHFTQPPPRYTEATLVRTLEEKGIGRPSTYAPIIDTVQRRGYARKDSNRFVPTELGLLVTGVLTKFFAPIIDVDFTAHLERQLDLVEAGEVEWRHIMEEFYPGLASMLDKAEEEIGGLEQGDEPTDQRCQECHRFLVIKHGRYGRFLACPGFPECRFTTPLLEEIGVACPECGEAIVERTSRKGRKFFGCSGFPECRFVSWNRPVDEMCPECGKLLVEKSTKRLGLRHVCPDRECGYARSVEEGEETS